MDLSANLTVYDFVILGLFALLIGRGIWVGFIRQVTGLLALYIGYLVASRYHQQLFPFLQDFLDNPKMVFLASYAIVFIATYVLVMLFGKLLAYVIQLTITGWFDRFLGAVLGAAKALILAVMLHMILGTVLSPDNQTIRSCVSCDGLNQAVDSTLKLIQSEDVRKALKQREPAISLDAVKQVLKNSGEPESPPEDKQ